MEKSRQQLDPVRQSAGTWLRKEIIIRKEYGLILHGLQVAPFRPALQEVQFLRCAAGLKSAGRDHQDLRIIAGNLFPGSDDAVPTRIG